MLLVPNFFAWRGGYSPYCPMGSIIVLVRCHRHSLRRTACWALAFGTHKGYRHSDEFLSKSTVLLSSRCKLHCSLAPHFYYLQWFHSCRGRDIIASQWIMDEGTIKTQNPRCRLSWCLIEFIEWRHRPSCWYFRPFLWTDASIPFLWPPPPQSKCTVYTDSVCLWGGGGALSCTVDHILQEFNTLFLTRFRTYKIATPPQTKTPLKATFRDWCLFSSFIHALNEWPNIILM